MKKTLKKKTTRRTKKSRSMDDSFVANKIMSSIEGLLEGGKKEYLNEQLIKGMATHLIYVVLINEGLDGVQEMVENAEEIASGHCTNCGEEF